MAIATRELAVGTALRGPEGAGKTGCRDAEEEGERRRVLEG